MNDARFPTVFLVLPFLPPLALLVTHILPDTTHRFAVFHFLLLLSAVGALVAYTHQVRYIQKTLQISLKPQFWLIAGAVMLPVVGAVIGDTQGAIDFDNPKGSTIPMFFVVLSLLWGAVGVVLCAIGNVFTIVTNGQNNVLRVLGTVAICLLWIGVAFLSYMAYSLAYSLRNPNTE